MGCLLAACRPATTEPVPTYSLDRSGAEWVVVFATPGVVRMHLACQDEPGHITALSAAVGPNRPIHIKPGQWVEWTYRQGDETRSSRLAELDHC